MHRLLDLLIRAVDWLGRIKDTWEISPWFWRVVWFLFGPGVIGYGAYEVDLPVAGKVFFFVLCMTLWCTAAYLWTLARERRGHAPTLVTPVPSRAAPSEHPANIDGRVALLYAANGTWAPKPHNAPVTADTARELQRVLDALDRFYEAASHEGGLRVWGRTLMSRPLRPIEHTHWQDWHIRHPDIFGTEPLRTVPRDKLPSGSSPYFDIHLNKADVEHLWPHGRLRMHDAARICFEETGLFGDTSLSGDVRLYQFVVLIIMEANRNPDRLSVWGRQLPSSKMARIPPERLLTKYLHDNGRTLLAELSFQTVEDWVDLSLPSAELPPFIDRLKRKETPGQQLAS